MTFVEWVYRPKACDFDKLPPYLRVALTAPCCSAIHDRGYACTRITGHTGRHAAGAFDRIVAVWR